jgi:hypothetical protein
MPNPDQGLGQAFAFSGGILSGLEIKRIWQAGKTGWSPDHGNDANHYCTALIIYTRHSEAWPGDRTAIAINGHASTANDIPYNRENHLLFHRP